MELREIVLDALRRHSMELASELVFNPDVNNGMYIPIRVSRLTGKAEPTQRQIVDLKNDLIASGVGPEFILIDKMVKSLEGDLRMSLLTSQPDLVRNVFVTVNGRVAEVWIDEKRQLDKIQMSIIRKNVDKCLEFYGISDASVVYMAEQSLATNTEVLSIIRKNSPLDADSLKGYLVTLGFPVPSLDWINRKLDSLRKADAVIRLPSGSYVLTAASLHKLGTRKDRHSPDVSRLLALARRGG